MIEKSLQQEGLPLRYKLVLFLLFLFTGCAIVTQEEHLKLKEQVARLQMEMRELERKSDVELKKMVEESNKELRKNLTELLGRIETLKGDVQAVISKFEESHHQSELMLKEARELKESYSVKLKELEDMVKSLQQRVKTLEEGAVKTPSPKALSPEEIISKAEDAFKNQNYEESKQLLQNFIKDFPSHKDREKALFLLGECYFEEGTMLMKRGKHAEGKKSLEMAILQYDELINQYPKGQKTPNALYKEALAFLALGDKTYSKVLLRRILERYPKSDTAQLAKKKLLEIK